MGRHDVQDFLERALPRLEGSGGAAQSASLKTWLGPASTGR
jgi:hypothetical protein